jgi:hypothetical protein
MTSTGLIDDADATVRCAAILTLALTGQGLDLLHDSIDRLLGDDEQIEGPALGEELRFGSPLIRCCADVAYMLLEDAPGLAGFRPLNFSGSFDSDLQVLESTAAETPRSYVEQ